MIVLDIETTGTNPHRNCMLSLGAVDYDSGKEFYGECSIRYGSVVEPIALEINGFKLEDIQPGMKQTPEALYFRFVLWAANAQLEMVLGGHNVGHLDILFLEEIHASHWYGLEMVEQFPFSYRTVDLHSVAFAILGKSLSHEGICKELDLPPEPKPHNALAGAKSERDAFKELFFRMGETRFGHSWPMA